MFNNFAAQSIQSIDLSCIEPDKPMFLSYDGNTVYIPLYPDMEQANINNLTALGRRITYHELNNLIVQANNQSNLTSIVQSSNQYNLTPITQPNNQCNLTPVQSSSQYNLTPVVCNEIDLVVDNLGEYDSYVSAANIGSAITLLTFISLVCNVAGGSSSIFLGFPAMFAVSSIATLMSLGSMSSIESHLTKSSKIVNGISTLSLYKLLTFIKSNNPNIETLYISCDVPKKSFYERECLKHLNFVTNKYNPNSQKTIEVGDRAFYYCYNIETVTYSDCTNLVLKESCFDSCESLTSFDFTNVELDSNGSQFSNSGLTSININKVMDIPCYCFYQCKNLKSFTISSSEGYNSKFSNIGAYSFQFCDNLEEVIINVPCEEISKYTFDCCYALKNVVLPNTVKCIGKEAFASTSIESIVLPNSLEYICDGAFRNTNLRTIKIPRSIKSVDANVFENCYDLNVIYLPNCNQMSKRIALDLKEYAFQNNLHYVIEFY